MKKFFVLTVIILSALALSAQNNQNNSQQKKEKVSGGLYLKGGLSWLMSDSKPLLPKNKAKLSYGFGATMDWNFSKNFSLNIAAGLTGIGGTTEFKNGIIGLTDDDGTMIPSIGDTLTHSYKFSSSYIEIPIGIKGCTNEIGYFTYFLKLGADPMFRIKSKMRPMDQDGNMQYTITKSTNLINIGWHVGGGFEWTLAGNTKLLVELAYLGTLLDFDKAKTMKNADKNYEQFNPSIKLNDISLKVGVVF